MANVNGAWTALPQATTIPLPEFVPDSSRISSSFLQNPQAFGPVAKAPGGPVRFGTAARLAGPALGGAALALSGCQPQSSGVLSESQTYPIPPDLVTKDVTQESLRQSLEVLIEQDTQIYDSAVGMNANPLEFAKTPDLSVDYLTALANHVGIDVDRPMGWQGEIAESVAFWGGLILASAVVYDVYRKRVLFPGGVAALGSSFVGLMVMHSFFWGPQMVTAMINQYQLGEGLVPSSENIAFNMVFAAFTIRVFYGGFWPMVGIFGFMNLGPVAYRVTPQTTRQDRLIHRGDRFYEMPHDQSLEASDSERFLDIPGLALCVQKIGQNFPETRLGQMAARITEAQRRQRRKNNPAFPYEDLFASDSSLFNFSVSAEHLYDQSDEVRLGPWAKLKHRLGWDQAPSSVVQELQGVKGSLAFKNRDIDFLSTLEDLINQAKGALDIDVKVEADTLLPVHDSMLMNRRGVPVLVSANTGRGFWGKLWSITNKPNREEKELDAQQVTLMEGAVIQRQDGKMARVLKPKRLFGRFRIFNDTLNPGDGILLAGSTIRVDGKVITLEEDTGVVSQMNVVKGNLQVFESLTIISGEIKMRHEVDRPQKVEPWARALNIFYPLRALLRELAPLRVRDQLEYLVEKQEVLARSKIHMTFSGDVGALLEEVPRAVANRPTHLLRPLRVVPSERAVASFVTWVSAPYSWIVTPLSGLLRPFRNTIRKAIKTKTPVVVSLDFADQNPSFHKKSLLELAAEERYVSRLKGHLEMPQSGALAEKQSLYRDFIVTAIDQDSLTPEVHHRLQTMLAKGGSWSDAVVEDRESRWVIDSWRRPWPRRVPKGKDIVVKLDAEKLVMAMQNKGDSLQGLAEKGLLRTRAGQRLLETHQAWQPGPFEVMAQKVKPGDTRTLSELYPDQETFDEDESWVAWAQRRGHGMAGVMLTSGRLLTARNQGLYNYFWGNGRIALLMSTMLAAFPLGYAAICTMRYAQGVQEVDRYLVSGFRGAGSGIANSIGAPPLLNTLGASNMHYFAFSGPSLAFQNLWEIPIELSIYDRLLYDNGIQHIQREDRPEHRRRVGHRLQVLELKALWHRPGLRSGFLGHRLANFIDTGVVGKNDVSVLVEMYEKGDGQSDFNDHFLAALSSDRSLWRAVESDKEAKAFFQQEMDEHKTGIDHFLKERESSKNE